MVTQANGDGDPPIPQRLGLLEQTRSGAVGAARAGGPGRWAARAPNPNPNEHGGFGLNIVSACTSRWGTGISDTGKNVWFEPCP